jgi:hypothetical protein
VATRHSPTTGDVETLLSTLGIRNTAASCVPVPADGYTPTDRRPVVLGPSPVRHRIPVPPDGANPDLAQIFQVDEGALADEVIDTTKPRNFGLTII